MSIDVLRQHVLPQVVCSAALRAAGRRVGLVNVDRRLINVSVVDGGGRSGSGNDGLFIDDKVLIESDLMATNGVIHVIDGVMFTELGV